MAQTKVSEFFNARKRRADSQPSKRIKLSNISENETVNEVTLPNLTSPPVAARTRRNRGKIIEPPNLNAPTQNKTRKGSTRAKSSKQLITPGQLDIREQLKLKSNVGIPSSEESDSTSPFEETTAICDDHHASPPCTPTKRSSSEEKLVPTKRRRGTKLQPIDLLNDLSKTPEAYDFTSFSTDKTKSARKKLVLPRKLDENEEAPAPPAFSDEEVETKVQTQKPSESTSEDTKNKEGSVAHKEEKVTPVISNVESPAPKSLNQPGKEVSKKPVENESSNTRSKKLDPAQLRTKLAKTGKLADLQAKLAEYSTSVKKVKEARNKALQDEVAQLKEDQVNKGEIVKPSIQANVKESSQSDKVVKKAPAFERFHHLAQPIPPSLTLPRKYKLLQEMFHGVETVVGMLYKRSESCTFSKLKGAVQQMTNKNFEEKNLGQIKTVYDDAYTFRQEKNFPKSGYHDVAASHYMLTVDPILNNPDEKFDSEGRPAFTASKMLERKNFFHRSLIRMVKQIHKEFLQTLNRPLEVEDDKITRWHPRFKLDELPDIEAATLPQPPDIKKFTTAREVLEEAKGKLNPRIQKALELIAGPKPEPPREKKNEPDKNKPKESTPDKSQEKGVSLSLLERIRAKEARKQESLLMRTPKDDLRLTMMQRLPELCRILKTHFTTQKKPAILLEDGITMMSQSYHSPLGIAETEKHLKLMVELLPDWVSVLKIARGSFLKIDRNKDINVVIQRLAKLIKDAT